MKVFLGPARFSQVIRRFIGVGWMFNLLVAIGRADGSLQVELRRFLRKDRGVDFHPEKWERKDDGEEIKE